MQVRSGCEYYSLSHQVILQETIWVPGPNLDQQRNKMVCTQPVTYRQQGVDILIVMDKHPGINSTLV